MMYRLGRPLSRSLCRSLDHRHVPLAAVPVRYTSWEKNWKKFWKGSQENSADDIVIDEDSTQVKSSKNQLMNPYGEDAPKMSPVIILPTSRHAVFPGFIGHHLVRDTVTINALLTNNERYVGLFLKTEHDHEKDTAEFDVIKKLDDIYKVGCFAQVQEMIKTAGGLQLALVGVRRLEIDKLVSLGPPTRASVNHWKDHRILKQSNEVKAYLNELRFAVSELLKINPSSHYNLQQWVFSTNFSDPYKLSDFATAFTSADPSEKQKVLEAKDAEDRLVLALGLVQKEKELARLQKKISQQVEEKVTKQQRDYMLREQIKTINKELGVEKDDKEELVKKYTERLESFKQQLLPATKKTIEDEIDRLSSMDKNSPEYTVSRNYLEWLTTVPWASFTKDELNLHHASDVLTKDHYGLEDVKKRILEFIAVGKLRGSVGGNIICFIGPPGVGKTSIAKSIAEALNRKFYRFSVGGLHDIAEIKGHRRTYIGAMPGKPIISLKSTGSLNPLILIDEIDKIGRGSHHGDPGSALLELLDPNQNSSFVDHYLDVPVDFSNVLFICTANDESAISGPLRDRMDIIRISGYDIPEKIAIAKKYLLPKALVNSGLKKYDEMKIDVGDDALDLLVRQYCRESGVRNLERHVEMLARKIAYKVVHAAEEKEPKVPPVNSTTESSSSLPADSKASEDINQLKVDIVDATARKINIEEVTVSVHASNLAEFVGQPRYSQSNIYDCEKMPVGVVMGLGWSPLGGSPIFIEAVGVPSGDESGRGGGSIHTVTGQLGTVMKESVNIAYTYSRQLVAQKYPENKYLKTYGVHLHCPEGAIEKDGPSAGIAMATSLISLAINTPVLPRLAMTGEISLTGKVLPVGGIKEKILAAKRSGAITVILPKENTKDFAELPEYVKEGVTFIFASEYSEVYSVAFPSK